MNAELLLTFAVVAEAGNISRAAEQLHLSQSAVSGQLRLLQENVGEPLYQRHSRGILLTAAGHGLLVHARRLRRELDEASAYRDRLRGLETGSLRIGASSTIASFLLPHLLAGFVARYPGVKVSVSTGNTGEVLRRLAECDIGFVEGPVKVGGPERIEAKPWRDDEIVLMVRSDHPLARAKRGASLVRIAAYPMVAREAGSGAREIIEAALKRAQLAPVIALEVAGVEAVKEAVRAGLGVGYASALALQHADPGLTAVRIDPPKGLRRVLTVLLPPAEMRSRAAQMFMESSDVKIAGARRIAPHR